MENKATTCYNKLKDPNREEGTKQFLRSTLVGIKMMISKIG